MRWYIYLANSFLGRGKYLKLFHVGFRLIINITTKHIETKNMNDYLSK